MKTHKRKGFTLVELIIVVALFSIIMYSVIQLMNPVSKFFVRSSNFENTTACVDNMKRAIEGNLKYADRVRVYSGFAPYTYEPDPAALDTPEVRLRRLIGDDGNFYVSGDDAAAYAPSDSLKANVKAFYDEFFKDRHFLDCEGDIYVLVFDNTRVASDDVLKNNYGLLSDISDNYLNAGKMVLIRYHFDNDAVPLFSYTAHTPVVESPDDAFVDGLDLNHPVITPWYVNQKLYGAFEYEFHLGRSFSDDATVSETTTDATATTTETTTTETTTSDPLVDPGDPASPSVVFNPADCTISITMNEIIKSQDGGLARGETSHATVASFSMKNVLDGASSYNKPLYDYITTIDPDAADTKSRYVTSSTGVPRYKAVEEGTGFDGFYFIFTLAETTEDHVDDEYMNAWAETTGP